MFVIDIQCTRNYLVELMILIFIDTCNNLVYTLIAGNTAANDITVSCYIRSSCVNVKVDSCSVSPHAAIKSGPQVSQSLISPVEISQVGPSICFSSYLPQ